MQHDPTLIQVPTPRSYGLINWVGAWNLYLKEVRRFLNVYTQTIAAPMVTTLLFLAIFCLVLVSSWSRLMRAGDVRSLIIFVAQSASP